MKPLFVLAGAFVISLAATRLFTGEYAHLASGRIALSVMLLFTAIGHFVFTKGMYFRRKKEFEPEFIDHRYLYNLWYCQ